MKGPIAYRIRKTEVNLWVCGTSCWCGESEKADEYTEKTYHADRAATKVGIFYGQGLLSSSAFKILRLG
jgi:hypothetical protein